MAVKSMQMTQENEDLNKNEHSDNFVTSFW
jgi:hypothetical protein